MVSIIKKAQASLPTSYGLFSIVAFSCSDGKDHVALLHGPIRKNMVCRVHSECLTGDVFSSSRCDCHHQLVSSLKLIGKKGGILVYLRQEGRGIGLLSKIKAYHLQDQGLDTVEANIKLGFKPDQRAYDIAGVILNHLGVKSVRLMTNNPEKIKSLEAFGIHVKDRLKISSPKGKKISSYIETKKKKLGHLF